MEGRKRKIMAELYDITQTVEKVILIGVSTGDSNMMKESLDELEELADTAGAVTVGKVIQNLPQIQQGTYIGTGKIAEICNLIAETGATGVICDDELSPAQLKNLEEGLGTKVMDRTLLILDIFAARASTSEGKIQVEPVSYTHLALTLLFQNSPIKQRLCF